MILEKILCTHYLAYIYELESTNTINFKNENTNGYIKEGCNICDGLNLQCNNYINYTILE